jgi:hypothetical protein
MPRQAKVSLSVDYIEMTPEQEIAWRAGLLLLLQIMKCAKCDAPEPILVHECINVEVACE